MSRTTTRELQSLVKMINERLGRPEYGWYRVGQEPDARNVARVGALTLDISYGQPRLQEVVSGTGAVREVGPRLPRGQMADQLRAILAGIDFAEANLGGYGKLPPWQPADTAFPGEVTA